MAKKKTIPEDTSAPPAAPVRRRAPAKKKTESVATASDTGANGGEPSHAEIAEAAYFRHLKRGASHGDEFNDWVEAERELRERRR